MAKSVTVIGGGTGSFTVIDGLKRYRDLNVQSIVSMMDSGGDSGRLRDEFGVLPPGDVRRCLVALSEESQLMRDLFSFRFEDSSLEGRSLGNLFFIAMTQILGSERASVEAISRILKIRGQVIPVTWDNSHIIAELEDGTLVRGEANIDVPKHDPLVPIRRVFLEPAASANPDAIDAIRDCDVVVLAPGDLYTSTIPNLLVGGVREALGTTRAPLVYVLNLMTKIGETHGYNATKHVEEIARYAGRMPDAVLVHDGPIPKELVARYKAECAHQVDVDIDELRRVGVRIVQSRPIMSANSLVRHDASKVGRELMQLFSKLGQISSARRAMRRPAYLEAI